MKVLDFDKLNRQFERTNPRVILEWAWSNFSSTVVVTSSFQSQSVPLLHMISKSVPELKIFFLDTGFHFPETLAYRDLVAEKLGLNLQIIKPKARKDAFIRQHGELYKSNPDLCCYMNKVEPLSRALEGMDAWISGIRRDQTSQRASIPILSKRKDGIIKISPLASWTDKDIWNYINDNDLPVHPLMAEGYLSIGCSPCTRPVISGRDERSGRWYGRGKTECGLHLPISEEKFEE